MAETKTRRRWKTELILRYEATSTKEDPADNNTEVPTAPEAEVPPDKDAATTGHEDPAVAVQVVEFL